MNKQREKLMADLQRLLETKDFKSEEDLRKFMNTMVGQKVPSFPKETLNKKEQAQDLVFEAYDLTPAKAKAKIEKALQLDSECIEAYEYLGSIEQTTEIAIVFFEKGISIGRQIFGGNYLKENKGMFWGFHETRPFMRCLQQYSECLYAMGKIKESVVILEEMIVLNPNDNQGARDQLLLYLIRLDENKKFMKYAKMYEDDSMAFALFNRALFAFKTEGASQNANKQLSKALQQNKHVAKRLLSNKIITELSDYYGFGDENEADYYVSCAQEVWQETDGAREWLKKQHAKLQ
jgi:tetratricopeptide (TPR) repeat protein